VGYGRQKGCLPTAHSFNPQLEIRNKRRRECRLIDELNILQKSIIIFLTFLEILEAVPLVKFFEEWFVLALDKNDSSADEFLDNMDQA
jgi:hypothetical protein